MINTTIILVALAIVACSERSNFTKEEVAVAAASANPMAAFASATAALVPDTARTVTRRILTGLDRNIWVSPTPDGRHISVWDPSTGDLALRDLETGGLRHLTHNTAPFSPGMALNSRVSPDGRWVAYNWMCNPGGKMGLGVVDIEGMHPRLIYSDTATAWIAPTDWSPDSRSVLAWREVEDRTEIVLISAEDGITRVLKTFQNEAPHGMGLSADGRFLVSDLTRVDGSDKRNIFITAIDGSYESVLVGDPADDYLLGWVPGRDYILFASDRLGTPSAWLLPVSDGRRTGEPELVKPDLWQFVPVGFAADGRYFYGVRTGSREVYVTSFESENGTVVGPPAAVNPRPLNDDIRPRWSPDGRHIVYVSDRPAASRSIVIHSLESGAVREMDQLPYGNPVTVQWTPDGGSLLVEASYQGDSLDQATFYRLDLRTGESSVILRRIPEERANDPNLSADGRWVVYNEALEDSEGRYAFRIVREDLSTGDATELYRTPYGGWGQIREMSLSPDGDWLALSMRSSDEAPHRLLLVPAGGGEPRELLQAPVIGTAWMPDGGGLLVQRLQEDPLEGTVWELWMAPTDGGTPKSAGLTVNGGSSWGLDVRADGSQITYAAGVPAGELWVMENFLPEGGEGR